jgi:hypothetical protein
MEKTIQVSLKQSKSARFVARRIGGTPPFSSKETEPIATLSASQEAA